MSSLSFKTRCNVQMARDLYTHTTQNPPIVWLKTGRSSSLTHSKSNTFMAPWTPSQSIDSFTRISPPFPYPTAVEKHHEHERPPHLPPQHPIVRLNSGQSSSLTQSKSKTFMAPRTNSKTIDPFNHPVPNFNTMDDRASLWHNNLGLVGLQNTLA